MKGCEEKLKHALTSKTSDSVYFLSFLSFLSFKYEKGIDKIFEITRYFNHTNVLKMIIERFFH